MPCVEAGAKSTETGNGTTIPLIAAQRPTAVAIAAIHIFTTVGFVFRTYFEKVFSQFK